MSTKAEWTPFKGRRVKEQPAMTFLRGELIAERGRVVADPGTGHFVARRDTLMFRDWRPETPPLVSTAEHVSYPALVRPLDSLTNAVYYG